MTPTPEQQKIIDTNVESTLKILAFAGTGKTSTFVEYTSARPSEDFLYLAFNKSVETEAKRKFGSNVLPKTIHALAYKHKGCEFSDLGNLKYFQVAKAYHLDTYRSSMVCRTLEEWWNSADDQMLAHHVPDDVLNLLGGNHQDDIIKIAGKVWIDMIDSRNDLPMTHSGYLKLYQLSRPKIETSTILLDEAQDTNPVVIALLQDQLRHGTRLILCGDPYQQIYSWRGAVDAMDAFDVPTLHLSQSFRFGQAVANVANKLLKSFFPPMIERSILGLPSLESTIVDALPSDEQSTIICRTNAELFHRVARTPLSHVIGEEGFSQFLDTVNDVYCLYSGQRSEIKSRQVAFFKSFDALMEFAEQRLDSELQNKIELVVTFSDKIPEMISTIRRNLTTSTKAKLILCTGHKAKGLEWDNVELADDFADLFQENGKLVILGKEKPFTPKDEINLLYVTLTRAKKRLKLNHQLRRLVGV